MFHANSADKLNPVWPLAYINLQGKKVPAGPASGYFANNRAVQCLTVIERGRDHDCLYSKESEMTQVPNGTELARPFMPAKDFDLSKKFYETLGFEKLLDGEVAIFKVGTGSFILQRFYQKELADNFMMQLMVDDLDAWWQHLVSLDLPKQFNVKPPRAPAMQPWGLRIAYLEDPSGVLWHIGQRREGAIQD